MATLAQGVAALNRAALAYGQADANAVATATRQLSNRVLAGQGRAGASSGRLRGVGRHGARIGVATKLDGNVGIVRATGPAHLLDHPTRAHVVRARRGRVLRTPYGPRKFVVVSGTRGTYYFERAVEEFGPELVTVYTSEFHEATAGL